MFITKVAFEVEKENEELLTEMVKKKAATKIEFPGLISYEWWKNDKKNVVEYNYVSKWESKENFKAWLARPEHIESHKNKGQNNELKSKIKKTVTQYELVEV